jgi:hypothetical protein
MKIFRLMIGSLFLFVTMLWFPANTPASTRKAMTQAELDAEIQKNLNTPIACGCDAQDEEDLKSRISEATAVMQEYDRMIRYQASQNKDKKYTQNDYNAIQADALAALLNAKHPTATKYGGKRGVAGTEEDCESWVRPDVRACLAVVLRDHEEVHSRVCKAADKPLNPFVSWKTTQSLIETMDEEKRGYQKELQRINEELNKMKAFCALDLSVRRALQSLERNKTLEKEAWEHMGMIEWTTMY